MKQQLTLLLIIIIPKLLWSNGNYVFQDINQDYDLSNIGIMTMCEDENGFIWFGGMNGLYYHNTLSVEKIKLPSSSATISQTNNISKIYKDDNNTIWVCTSNGLFKYIRSNNTFEHKKLSFPIPTINNNINNIVQINDQEYLLHKHDAILLYNEQENVISTTKDSIRKKVTYIQKDISGYVHIGTSEGKVYQLKENINTIKLLYDSPKGRIACVCKDGSKYYIGHVLKGIDIINSNGAKIDEMNSSCTGNRYLKSDHARRIIRRENGEKWIATDAGIYVLKKGELILLDSRLQTGLPHRTIYRLHQGSNDKIWVSTYSGGLACYSKYNYLFKHILLNYPQKQLDKSHVSSISEDNHGHIWIGNEDEGGIKAYAPNKMDFIDDITAALPENTTGIKSILPINEEEIVYGTNKSTKIKFFNFKKQRLEREIDLPLFQNTGVRGMKLLNQSLWIYDSRNIVVYNIASQKIKATYLCPARIWQLYIDSSHNVWACTTNGLYIIRPGMNELEKCEFSTSGETLSQSSIYSVCEDMNGIIWVGTMGQGLYLYDPIKNTICTAPDHQLSADTDIYNLLKDKQNNMWYMTNKGLYRFDVEYNKTDYYGTNKGTINAHNRLNASYVSSTGQLYIGAKSGFTIIDPTLIKKNTTEPAVYLSDLKINNSPFACDSSLFKNALGLTQLRSIKLKAKENTLGIKIVSNNYIKAERNKFKYRLVNYDNNWVEIPQNKDITYTKVPPGNYIFEAFGSNNDQVWSKEPYRLMISIQRPLFSRWYSLCFYALLISGIGSIIYSEIKTKLKLKKEIAEERYKTKANEQIHSEKVQFFTNMSHELRTPLSLIVSPISRILHKSDIDEETMHLLKVVDRNAKRLQKIADQTIDFRLLEIGKLEPNFGSHEMIQLTKDVFLCFEQHFIDQEIEFIFSNDFNYLKVVADGDMIEKIIYNLLSNALKYTPAKKRITLSIYQRELTEEEYSQTFVTGHQFIGKAISITVKDTGPGIKEELMPHIFERFTKGELAHQNSTGIGLHLCKEYATMNKGNMQILNEIGKGATFTLNLPLMENTLFEKSEQNQLIQFNLAESKTAIDQKTSTSLSETILVVEDSGELRNILKIFLGQHFKVITAKNGEQAITQLENMQPDLILTDVTMPGINGIDMTRKLKQDPKHKYTPIIVMTAYAERRYQMESILSGADAFFTKPIDENMLLAQINNILNNKQTDDIATQHQTVVTEENFIKKAEMIIEKNLQNSKFEITDLLNELNISKTTLTRKLKAEVQMNPSGFIRDVRLKNAKELLNNPQFNIDEIASFVGFNYTSYFIKTFKDSFGITPSEYRKKMH